MKFFAKGQAAHAAGSAGGGQSAKPQGPTWTAETPAVELSQAELDDALATYRGGTYNHGYMNCGRGSAVIYALAGTSRYQTALHRIAITPRPWRHEYDRHLPAVLKPEGASAVRVLIDGMMVGHLRHKDADVVRGLVDELAATGQSLVGTALLVGGGAGKAHGIRLQIRPGAATRWAAGMKPADIP